MKSRLYLGLGAAIFLSPAVSLASFDGPYMGLGLGYVNNGGEIKTYLKSVASENFKSSVGGASGQLYAGYGFTFNGVYGAVQIHGGYDATKNELKLYNNQATREWVFKNNGTVGAALHAGRTFYEDTLLIYLGMGIDWKWYKVTSSQFFTGQKKINRWFLTPRIGVESHITEKLRGRFEVSYSFGMDHNKFTDTLTPQPKDYLTFKPYAMGVMVGLTYEF